MVERGTTRLRWWGAGDLPSFGLSIVQSGQRARRCLDVCGQRSSRPLCYRKNLLKGHGRCCPWGLTDAPDNECGLCGHNAGATHVGQRERRGWWLDQGKGSSRCTGGEYCPKRARKAKDRGLLRCALVTVSLHRREVVGTAMPTRGPRSRECPAGLLQRH